MRTLFITTMLLTATMTACGPARAAPTCKSASCVTLPSPEKRIALLTYLVDRKDKAAVMCDALTGTRRTGCAVLQGMIADARRAAAYADMAKGWDQDRRAAFARLLVAENAFAKAVGENETDHISADSGADAIVAQQAEKNAFLIMLKTIVAGDARLSFVEFAASDGALNAAYGQVMAVEDTSNLAWGSVEKSGIKRTQRAWIVYRDAFVAFAATLDASAAATVKAELTTRRTVSLEAFLAD